jgi:two-component system, NtrC family, sensor kinase
MIKTFSCCFLFTILCLTAFAQKRAIDSLRHLLAVARDDTSRVIILSELSLGYGALNADSAFSIAHRAIDLAQQINFPRGEVMGLTSLGNEFDTKGDLPQALALDFRGLSIAEENHLPLEKVMCLVNIGDIFWDLNDFPRAISNYQQAVQISGGIKNQPSLKSWLMRAEESLGAVFMLNSQLDSAFFHLKKLYDETLTDPYWHPGLLMFFGDLQFRMGKRDTGLDYLRQSIQLFQNDSDHYYLGDACRFISECFREMNMVDSSIFYAKRGLAEAQSIGYKSPILYNSRTLAELYESKDISQALHYRKVFDTANDIYYGPAKVKDLQKALSDEQERQRKIEAAAIAYQNRLKQYGLLAGFFLVLLVAFILYRNNRQKKKANYTLHLQKEKVESTLTELKTTQSQLIQSEKMASLGELTAGIAHEIQNPLNFVNNFSEVNKELLAEMNEEISKGNYDEVKSLAKDLSGNEEKISYHGKRADAIVKSMLQHSRSDKGKKELTDLNALADEYLRLAYHGIRAKDSTFNASMKTDFDESIGNISIVPQDFGRVLLNLYNNAFYAVSQKEKQQSEGPAAGARSGETYRPTVSVRTKKMDNKVEIRVRDNGNGIAEKVKEKIFQPFFTTKPTGLGTGLGLSLSYDIIKAHGGEIWVETKEGEGVEFVIQIPAI